MHDAPNKVVVFDPAKETVDPVAVKYSCVFIFIWIAALSRSLS